MSEPLPADLITVLEATRAVVLDTGCNWPDAARKALDEAELSDVSRSELLVTGLAQRAKVFDRQLAQRDEVGGPDVDALVEAALEPFVPFHALTRIFDVGESSKRFVDCTPEDLTYLANALKRSAAGFKASAVFVADVRVECVRQNVPDVGHLAAEILTHLNKTAPWGR